MKSLSDVCRAISVLLGDRWKKLKSDERRTFSQQAKQLAEQYRRQNPDCWKRKRSVSEVRSATQNFMTYWSYCFLR